MQPAPQVFVWRSPAMNPHSEPLNDLLDTAILVAAGTYRNQGWGSGSVNNPAVASFRHLDQILLQSLPGHAVRGSCSTLLIFQSEPCLK